MLAEVLLVLAGHPSSFYKPYSAAPSRPKTLRITEELEQYLHPGEVTNLNVLGDLAFRYTKVKSWATKIKHRGRDAILRQSIKGKQRETDDPPDQYLTTLACSILELLKDWDLLIVELEAKILILNPETVQDDQGYVPLSTLIATFSPWEAPLSALSYLVDQISSKHISPGKLMDLLSTTANNGNPRIREIFSNLSKDLETLFTSHLTLFLLDGIAPTESTPTSPSLGIDKGSDPLSPSHRLYILNSGLIPSSVSQQTRESILYVGRVAATLKRENRGLPKALVDALREEILSVSETGFEDGQLDRAVARARAEVGEWLWKHVLTGHQVAEALRSFGRIFLTRDADFAISTIREIHRLRINKLITSNPHSSSSVIREQDLTLALLRASVGTSVETNEHLEKLRFKLPKGSIRPLLSQLSPAKKRHTPQKTHQAQNDNLYDTDGSIRELFSSFILGSPVYLETTISWPLDLFMTPPAQAAYTDIHSYLFALRDTHQRVLDCWSSLSAAQKRRRKWTGITEGGTDDEVDDRRKLGRSAWGIIRAMLFFLDQLISHFMTDIIEVQHKRLLSELEGIDDIPSRSGSMAGTLKGSRSGTLARQGSMASGLRSRATSRSSLREELPPSPLASTAPDTMRGTMRSKPPPTPNRVEETYLDFLTLRTMHARYLSFLKEGLLIADKDFAVVIRDILDVCIRFTGLVERWGGDVLPDLLEEGTAGEKIGQLVKERSIAVAEINDELHDLISTFFRGLLDTLNPIANSDKSSADGTSSSRTARATQMIQSSRIMSRQISFSKAHITTLGKSKAQISVQQEKNAETDALMAKHIEQLLLRLDFNGVLTSRMEEDERVDNTAVLAEGGL